MLQATHPTTPSSRAPASLDVHLLEPLLQDWVRLLGLESTMRLVKRHGGTRLSIPANLDADHPLAKLLGLADAQVLARHYGGERPAVPKAERAVRAARNAWIAANPDGLSVPQLALATGLAERAVYHIRAAADLRTSPTAPITPWAGPSPQTDLF